MKILKCQLVAIFFRFTEIGAKNGCKKGLTRKREREKWTYNDWGYKRPHGREELRWLIAGDWRRDAIPLFKVTTKSSTKAMSQATKSKERRMKLQFFHWLNKYMTYNAYLYLTVNGAKKNQKILLIKNL